MRYARSTYIFQSVSANRTMQRLSQIAESNRTSYKASLASWVKSFTPLQIKEANEARKKLRRKLKTKKRQFPIIRDERQVKRPKSAFMMFLEELNGSGDFAHLKVAERGAEAGQRWKRLTESEKEVSYGIYRLLVFADSSPMFWAILPY